MSVYVFRPVILLGLCKNCVKIHDSITNCPRWVLVRAGHLPSPEGFSTSLEVFFLHRVPKKLAYNIVEYMCSDYCKTGPRQIGYVGVP